MSSKKRILYAIMTIFYVVMLFFLAMPGGTALIDRVEPHILGLPCFQAWILYGSLLMAIALIIWFALECKIENNEREQEDKAEGGE